MRTLFVTGGTGYLGSEVVRQAREAGFDVVAPPRAALDVRDVDAVTSAARGAHAIVHTAYRHAGDDAASINVEGTASVALAAARTGARLLHLSTDLVFDGETSRPYREDDEPRPIIPYGVTKLAAERLVRDVANGVVVRTSVLYGKPEPGNHERVVLDALEGRADVTFFTDEIRCPTRVFDLAAALLELVDSTFAGVLHVVGPDAVSRHDFACAVARAHGRDPAALRTSTSEGLGRPRDCSLDTTRASALLRTKMRGLSA